MTLAQVETAFELEGMRTFGAPTVAMRDRLRRDALPLVGLVQASPPPGVGRLIGRVRHRLGTEPAPYGTGLAKAYFHGMDDYMSALLDALDGTPPPGTSRLINTPQITGATTSVNLQPLIHGRPVAIGIAEDWLAILDHLVNASVPRSVAEGIATELAQHINRDRP